MCECERTEPSRKEEHARKVLTSCMLATESGKVLAVPTPGNGCRGLYTILQLYLCQDVPVLKQRRAYVTVAKMGLPVP